MESGGPLYVLINKCPASAKCELKAEQTSNGSEIRPLLPLTWVGRAEEELLLREFTAFQNFTGFPCEHVIRF